MVSLRAKLETVSNHELIADQASRIGLLQNVKNVSYNYQSEKLKRQALHEAKRQFYLFYQDRSMTCQQCLEKFNNLVEVIEHYGGGSMVDEKILQDKLPEFKPPILIGVATTAEKTKARDLAREKTLSIAFLLSADRNRYGRLVEDMENNYLQNIDTFPGSLIDVYTLLLHWKKDLKNLIRVVRATSDKISYGTINDSKKDV